MSDVVNTSVAPFCHSQNHSGSVPVPVLGMTARGAQEGSRSEIEVLLGFREALRTRDSRMRWPNHHHRSTSAFGSHHQFTLRAADCRVGGLPSHGGLGEEPWTKVFDRHELVVGNNSLRPNTSVVASLARSLLLQSGSVSLGSQVALGRRRPGPMTPRHSTLSFGQFSFTAFSVPGERQIVRRIRRCDRRAHAPIDTNAPGHDRDLLLVTPYDEGGAQSAVTETETALRILHRRKTCLARFELRRSPSLDRERVVQRSSVRAKHLLLCNLRTVAQPRILAARHSQELAQLAKCWFQARPVLMHSVVPQKPASMPLHHQLPHGGCARANPIGEAHRFDHSLKIPRTTDMKSPAERVPSSRVTDVSK